MKKRAALYCRVSTDRQVQEGESIQAQVDALKKYAKEHDYEIQDIYIDDGISGTLLDERDELQRLLENVKRKKIDILLFTKLDRYFRNVRHYLNTQTILDKYGVPWVAIWERYETQSPQGRLLVNQMLSFAEFEAAQTGQRITQVFSYKKTKHEVLSGKVPFGYKIENSHYVIDPEKAEIVRAVFKRYAETGNLGRTILETQGQGLPTTNRGFKLMLSNRRYIGEAHGQADYLEPIIDKELFDEVQHLLKINIKKNRVTTYIFSGLIKCAECGMSMGGQSDTYRHREDGKRYKAYRCSWHFNAIPKCSNKVRISEIKLEKYLVKNLRDLAFAEINADDEYKSADYQKQIDATKKKIARLKDLYINELIDLDEYKRDLAMYTRHIEDFEKCMDEYKGTDKSALKELVGKNLDEWYWTLTDEEKRTLWRGVIEKIIVDDQKNISVIFR